MKSWKNLSYCWIKKLSTWDSVETFGKKWDLKIFTIGMEAAAFGTCELAGWSQSQSIDNVGVELSMVRFLVFFFWF